MVEIDDPARLLPQGAGAIALTAAGTMSCRPPPGWQMRPDRMEEAGDDFHGHPQTRTSELMDKTAIGQTGEIPKRLIDGRTYEIVDGFQLQIMHHRCPG